MKFLHVADLHLDSPLRTRAVRDSAWGDETARGVAAGACATRRCGGVRGVAPVLSAWDIFDSDGGPGYFEASAHVQIGRS